LIDLDIHKLDSEPPTDFCCGSDDQDTFLHDHAWADQQNGLSTTYLAYRDGICVGYITVLGDAIDIPRHAWPAGARFGRYGASKIAQVAVDRRHTGRKYGEQLVTFAVMHALWVSRAMAVRYVVLDSVPERVKWYEKLDFRVHKPEQKVRRQDARRRGKNPDEIPVRMYYDLNKVPRDAEMMAKIDRIFRP
jgi:GNAT superfamily N-acetyltransferase